MVDVSFDKDDLIIEVLPGGKVTAYDRSKFRVISRLYYDQLQERHYPDDKAPKKLKGMLDI